MSNYRAQGVLEHCCQDSKVTNSTAASICRRNIDRKTKKYAPGMSGHLACACCCTRCVRVARRLKYSCAYWRWKVRVPVSTNRWPCGGALWRCWSEGGRGGECLVCERLRAVAMCGSSDESTRSTRWGALCCFAASVYMCGRLRC